MQRTIVQPIVYAVLAAAALITGAYAIAQQLWHGHKALSINACTDDQSQDNQSVLFINCGGFLE